MSEDKNKNVNTIPEEKVVKDEIELVCGIVRPIAEIDGLSSAHWDEVATIIDEAISDAGFRPNLVSNSEDIGVIQKRIVQNLYENPIVVCDVSAKNPNVMFELGLRLAFDKPTIIIKDDKTNYSFDTSPIEHLEYPRDLRFSKIMEFKAKLSSKIKNTYKKSIENEDYSTFLKHFGTFKVAKIRTEEVTKEDLIMDEVKLLRSLVLNMNRERKDFKYSIGRKQIFGRTLDVSFRLKEDDEGEVDDIWIIEKLDSLGIAEEINTWDESNNTISFSLNLKPHVSETQARTSLIKN